MITFRPATKADFARVYEKVPFTARAIAAERDGSFIGIGGFYYSEGRPVLFSRGEKSQLSKRDILICARAIMKMADQLKCPVFAVPEPTDAARRTLARFGFVPVDETFWARSNV